MSGTAGRRSPPPLGSVRSQSRGTLIESGTKRGLEGLAARPLRWSVTRASGSGARPLTVSLRSVSGQRSTARGAGKGRNAADGPGRRAIVPTAPQRGDRARLPLSSVQQVGVRKIVDTLPARVGAARLAGSTTVGSRRTGAGYEVSGRRMRADFRARASATAGRRGPQICCSVELFSKVPWSRPGENHGVPAERKLGKSECLGRGPSRISDVITPTYNEIRRLFTVLNDRNRTPMPTAICGWGLPSRLGDRSTSMAGDRGAHVADGVQDRERAEGEPGDGRQA
jgi:hypothetical protein